MGGSRCSNSLFQVFPIPWNLLSEYKIINPVFKNITFQKPTGPQVYETFLFGNYATTVSDLDFGFNEEVDKSTCVSDNRIFDFSGSEVFTLDVADYATLFANEVTTTPRTALISSSNKLSYRLYSGTITNDYFCATTIPTTPTLLQQWNAIDGIEVTHPSRQYKETVSVKKKLGRNERVMLQSPEGEMAFVKVKQADAYYQMGYRAI